MLSDYLIKTIELQSRNIYSIRKKMSLGDFGEAYAALLSGLEKNLFKQAGPVLSIYHEEDFDKDCMDIELGVEVAEETGENIRLLSPGLCCYMTCFGSYDDFNLCFMALLEWIYRQGYAISGPPIIIYVKGYTNCKKPDEFISEIYVPIRK